MYNEKKSFDLKEGPYNKLMQLSRFKGMTFAARIRMLISEELALSPKPADDAPTAIKFIDDYRTQDFSSAIQTAREVYIATADLLTFMRSHGHQSAITLRLLSNRPTGIFVPRYSSYGTEQKVALSYLQREVESLISRERSVSNISVNVIDEDEKVFPSFAFSDRSIAYLSFPASRGFIAPSPKTKCLVMPASESDIVTSQLAARHMIRHVIKDNLVSSWDSNYPDNDNE